jgi:prophage regulatory protein
MFLRIGVVMRLTGLGRSTIYRMMAEHSFPQPVRLSRRLIAWRRSDLDKWGNGRPEVSH